MEKHYKHYLTIVVMTQVIMCLVVGSIVTFFVHSIVTYDQELLSTTIIENNTEHMEELVDNTIVFIEDKRYVALKEVQQRIEIAAELVQYINEATYHEDIEQIVSFVNQGKYDGAIKIVYEGEKVRTASVDHEVFKPIEAVMYEVIELDTARVYVFATEKDVERIAKQSINDVMNTIDEYIWINEVQEGYKHTEKHRVLDEKMTYEKFYEPFNWVIVTSKDIQDITGIAGKSEMKIVVGIMSGCLILVNGVFFICSMILIKEHRKYKKSIDKYVKAETELDALTHVYSRKAGEMFLAKCFEVWQEHATQGALIMMVDVDNFKAINDTYGHDIGDSVLKQVAQALRESIGEEGYVIRWGGEEFIVIYNQPSCTHYAIGKRLLNNTRSILLEGSDSFQGSISIGSTYFEQDDTAYVDALKRADQALYYSKGTGKNRYTYFEDIQK